jgi:hypothetical protein
MLTTPQKRLIAALLPFSFLWVFVACVSICERETLANHSPTSLSCFAETNVLRDVPDCDGCPLSDFPKATTPERLKSIIAVEPSASFTPSAPSILSSQQNRFCNGFENPVLRGSPPLKLLSTLRI